MSFGEIATRPEISYFNLSPSVEQARQQVPPAQARLDQRLQQVFKPFKLFQMLFCGYFLVTWVLAGHYIGGPILALVLWCMTWILAWPLHWFARHERRELERAQENVGIVLHKARTDFLAEQDLGPYRWIYRGECMLGVFPESAVLYLYAPESNYQHALIEAPQVVRQVRVEERSQTVHTSQTHTTHDKRQVYSYGATNVIGEGQSNSTTRTTSSTYHTYNLQIQFQVGAQTPYWTTWSFGNDWEEAENWRLQIAQAAGLDLH